MGGDIHLLACPQLAEGVANYTTVLPRSAAPRVYCYCAFVPSLFHVFLTLRLHQTLCLMNRSKVRYDYDAEKKGCHATTKSDAR